jgi:hypothetical protein
MFFMIFSFLANFLSGGLFRKSWLFYRLSAGALIFSSYFFFTLWSGIGISSHESSTALKEKNISMQAVEKYHERKFIRPLWKHMMQSKKVKFDTSSKFAHGAPVYRFK